MKNEEIKIKIIRKRKTKKKQMKRKVWIKNAKRRKAIGRSRRKGFVISEMKRETEGIVR